MKDDVSRFLFDKRDHELIRIVNDVLRGKSRIKHARRLYYSYFHSHGIKEMAETRGFRIAFAIVHLLSSLEIGGMEDRINALRSLHSEVLDTAEGSMPKNTARVLLQIMKDLVRAHGNYRRQLQLAHDFRITASGKPRIVRRQLKHYHLLEMPEEWNQIAFDDHVHDANTKGRKSSTHLIMDAWIKGIRRLRVIHYNYIEPRFAAELLEAAKIMDIDVRIGIEFYARFRDKYVQLIWVPRGFADAQAFLCFLAELPVMKIMELGRQVSLYQQQHIPALLRKFNESHRLEINQDYGIELPPINEQEFLMFVGIGQKSRLHLAKFIHDQMLKVLQAQTERFLAEIPSASPERCSDITRWIESMNTLDLESVIDGYLDPEKNPEVKYPEVPVHGPDVPELLRLTPFEILDRLTKLYSGYRVTLNLTNLKAEEVIELLYDCQGMISRLEIFNLKDHAAGKTSHIGEISRLQEAINKGSAIRLKQIIREIIERLKWSDTSVDTQRINKLITILYDIDILKSYYAGKSLKARIGSDSTGRSPKVHGMGLAIKETLPKRAQRQVIRDCFAGHRETIPIRVDAYKYKVYIPLHDNRPLGRIFEGLSRILNVFSWTGVARREGWQVQAASTRMTHPGNIITLGGAQKEIVNGLYLNPPELQKNWGRFRWSYLNSNLKKILKVLLGFIPAFLTFALTKDWWVLAYGGAFIWFGITGLRNILQSVLGGGGFRRSPLLNWNDYISWTRITDSLLFTGFSVPLLDYAVKTVILNRGFGITTATHPVLLYTFMALANGVYLSSHNIFRGLPKGAIYGNFFRSILSIPVAVALNSSIGGILPMFGAVDVNDILQKWAAIISKAASDFVAGFIEGTADRYKNIQMRFREHQKKFTDILDIYAQLELLYPDVETFKILEHSSDLKRKANAEAQDLEKIIMIHALDMLYFWMYQPRSRSALQQFLQTLSEDERHILVSSNFTLQRHREISQMFIDGILGSNFPRPLSFYLSSYEGYLEEIKRLVLSEEFSNAYTQNRLSDFADPEVPPIVAVDEAVGSTGGLLHPPETVCVQDEHKNGLKTKKG
ncbi:MAG: hypothetical protein WBI57_09385 [Desulfobacterales bacterium]